MSACVMSARASATVAECSAAAGPVGVQAPAAPLLVRTADGSYTLSRAVLHQTLADPSALSSTVRFMPVMKAKHVVAYKVAYVAEGSPLAGVLKAGDRVERINGVPLSDLNRSVALLSSIDEQTRFDIAGRRGKGALLLSVTLTD